jgi:hypothetical protein
MSEQIRLFKPLTILEHPLTISKPAPQSPLQTIKGEVGLVTLSKII